MRSRFISTAHRLAMQYTLAPRTTALFGYAGACAFFIADHPGTVLPIEPSIWLAFGKAMCGIVWIHVVLYLFIFFTRSKQ